MTGHWKYNDANIIFVNTSQEAKFHRLGRLGKKC